MSLSDAIALFSDATDGAEVLEVLDYVVTEAVTDGVEAQTEG